MKHSYKLWYIKKDIILNPPVHLCFNISKDLKRALIKNYAYIESSKNVKTCTFSKVPFIVREIIPSMLFGFFIYRSA